MKKYIFSLISTILICMSVACGSDSKTHQYAGVFVDEFQNRFELKEDGTGTILFVGQSDPVNITWKDGSENKVPFGTIQYNGDPAYYYMRDGVLYRHKEDMDKGQCAIEIQYEK